MPTKKLDAIVYYEKYVVVKPGVMEGRKDAEGIELNGSHKMDLLSEEEYIDILDNQVAPNNDQLDDNDPNKFVAKMGAEAIYDLLTDLDLEDRKSTRLNSSHANISYAVFCLTKK